MPFLNARPRPKYEVGDYLTIYCGPNEGCCFWVQSMEWREPSMVGIHQVLGGWYYDTRAYGWRHESAICTEGHARFFR